MRERQSSAIASRLKDPKRESAENAGVDGAPTRPKPGKGSNSASPASVTKGSPDPASPKDSTPSDSDAQSTDGAKSSGQATPEQAAAPAAKGPRYELKSFKKWAEQNPEQAAEIAAEVFRVGEDPKQEWIRQQNKGRKLKESLQAEKAATVAEAKAEREAAASERERAEQIAGQITYLSEMWAAASRKNANGQPDPDFDTIDEAFKQNTGGISIDDYNRLRARRGVANPEVARLKAENARLARLAAANAGQPAPALLPAGQTNGAAATANAGEPAPPRAAVAAPGTAAPEVDVEALWGGELPKAHPIRRLAGWADELHAEMQKYHDETLDEYSRDPEDVAAVVLKRMLKAFEPEEVEGEPVKRMPAAKRPNTPKTRTGRTAFSEEKAPVDVPGIPSAAKLAPRGKVNEDRSHRETTLDEIQGFDGGLAARERRAMERHKLRLAGKLVD